MAKSAEEPQQSDEPSDERRQQSPQAADPPLREPTAQPMRPSQTATSAPSPQPVVPVPSLAAPQPEASSRSLVMTYPATVLPPTNTGQLVPPVAIPQIQQALPPIQQALPPIQVPTAPLPAPKLPRFPNKPLASCQGCPLHLYPNCLSRLIYASNGADLKGAGCVAEITAD